MNIDFKTISGALAQKLELELKLNDACTAIFRLKKDDALSDDDFDERRLELNLTRIKCEGEIRIIDAWIEEQRAVQRKANAPVNASLEAQRLALDREKEKTARILEQQRLALAATEAKANRDAQHERARAKMYKDALRVAVGALVGKMPADVALMAIDTAMQGFTDSVRGREPLARVRTADEILKQALETPAAV